MRLGEADSGHSIVLSGVKVSPTLPREVIFRYPDQSLPKCSHFHFVLQQLSLSLTLALSLLFLPPYLFCASRSLCCRASSFSVSFRCPASSYSHALRRRASYSSLALRRHIPSSSRSCSSRIFSDSSRTLCWVRLRLAISRSRTAALEAFDASDLRDRLDDARLTTDTASPSRLTGPCSAVDADSPSSIAESDVSFGFRLLGGGTPSTLHCSVHSWSRASRDLSFPRIRLRRSFRISISWPS